MSGCKPLKARSRVRADIPSRAASALSGPTQDAKSARAGAAASVTVEAARDQRTKRLMGSIIIGRIAGTAVKIHITFILFLAWIAFSAWNRGGAAAALDSTLFIVLLF